MPVYKHRDTGQEATHTEDFVSSFEEGTWEKVADESEDEKQARLREEAALAKVDIEDDDAADDSGSTSSAKKGASKK